MAVHRVLYGLYQLSSEQAKTRMNEPSLVGSRINSTSLLQNCLGIAKGCTNPVQFDSPDRFATLSNMIHIHTHSLSDPAAGAKAALKIMGGTTDALSLQLLGEKER